jgi:hypothetical protein
VYATNECKQQATTSNKLKQQATVTTSNKLKQQATRQATSARNKHNLSNTLQQATI